MASIAQQDNLYIDLPEEIDSYSSGFPKAIWDVIVAKFKAGILPDCIFRFAETGVFWKVCSCTISQGALFSVSVVFEKSVMELTEAQE